MQYARSDEVLRSMFRAHGLAPEALEPWEAWKVFKAYLRVPVDGPVDDALVQYGRYDDADCAPRSHLYFVREFSMPELSEAESPFDAGGEPLTHVVCDLIFESGDLAPPVPVEFWTQDRQSLTAFIDAVEADQGFQRLMNARSVRSSVYVEEH
jgi:hypothetical protein